VALWTISVYSTKTIKTDPRLPERISHLKLNCYSRFLVTDIAYY